MRIFSPVVAACALACCAPNELDEQHAHAKSIFNVAARLKTPAIHQYDDAPRSPDADDSAIWLDPDNAGEGLVIGTLKDGGLHVYDLTGAIVQALAPANRLPLSAEDPPILGQEPDPGTEACPESESGETFGRYNNVDIQYELELEDGTELDIAVVSDRGCDRLRIFGIDPAREDGPLFDLTDPAAERIFPTQFVQPSRLQPGELEPGEYENPLDDEFTAYGLTVFDEQVFVNQAGRSVVAQLELYATPENTISYRRVREFRFDAELELKNGVAWTPCREDPNEDPQFEGLVVDREREILYAGQEAVGIWKIKLRDSLPEIVSVRQRDLLEPVKSFGLPYFALPEDDEYACQLKEPAFPPEGMITAPGDPDAAGKRIEADLEGLTIYYSGENSGYLLASSQGDNTFHVFRRSSSNKYLGAFRVTGAGETDGMEVTNARAGEAFPQGMLVVQSGEAEPPANTDPINGFEYDGSTEFHFVAWEDVANGFKPPLSIEPDDFDPRDAD